MRTGLISHRLIGVLLAITTLCPSWISAPCCCTQKTLVKSSPAACCSQASKGMAAVSTKPKRACCAARAIVATAEPQDPVAVRPVSSCCCRLHLNAATVSNLVRPVELTISPCDVPVANSRPEILPVRPGFDLVQVSGGESDEPPDPSERCARLCRWLA